MELSNLSYKLLKKALGTLGIFLVANSITFCGGAGESPSTSAGSSDLLGSSQVLGSISTVSGSTLTGWVVALVDADSEVVRTTSVAASGLISFSNINTSRTYTMVLLSPTLRVSAVMYQPIENSTAFYNQYFRLASETLPPIVVDGKAMRFQTKTGVTFNSKLTADGDGDGISDGMAQFSLTGSLGLVGSTDLDNDGIPDSEDGDVDGDGVVNVFDSDDDNDGVLDIFDADSNNDLVEDHINEKNDQYFDEGVEWITVMYKYDVQTGKRSLAFVAKVRDGVNPTSVQVKGPASLLNAATVEYQDEDGNVSSQLFNGVLLDEGNDGDSSAGDLVFGRTIVLDSAASLLSNTVVFVQLVFGDSTSASFVEFPYLLSLGTPNSIGLTMTGSGASTSASVGAPQPFGSYQYYYSVDAYDSAGALIWNSGSTLIENVSGGPGLTMIPTGISADTTCSFQASARSLDRIPGYSNYTVTSDIESYACP